MAFKVIIVSKTHSSCANNRTIGHLNLYLLQGKPKFVESNRNHSSKRKQNIDFELTYEEKLSYTFNEWKI